MFSKIFRPKTEKFATILTPSYLFPLHGVVLMQKPSNNSIYLSFDVMLKWTNDMHISSHTGYIHDSFVTFNVTIVDQASKLETAGQIASTNLLKILPMLLA